MITAAPPKATKKKNTEKNMPPKNSRRFFSTPKELAKENARLRRQLSTIRKELANERSLVKMIIKKNQKRMAKKQSIQYGLTKEWLQERRKAGKYREIIHCIMHEVKQIETELSAITSELLVTKPKTARINITNPPTPTKI